MILFCCVWAIGKDLKSVEKVEKEEKSKVEGEKEINKKSALKSLILIRFMLFNLP